MNDRIKELEQQCWEVRQYNPPWFNATKFAELIMREFIGILEEEIKLVEEFKSTAVKADVIKCHNCGVNISFNNFLKQLDPVIYKQYTFEKFKDGKTGKNFTVDEPKFHFEAPKFRPKLDLPKASENPISKLYLEKRKLNPDKFYYTDKFKEWTNSFRQTFDSTDKDEPRIIIPLFYQNNLVGFQGRALGPSKVKYITVMLNDDAPKIYGLDEVQKSETVYITEGPFDSTFRTASHLAKFGNSVSGNCG